MVSKKEKITTIKLSLNTKRRLAIYGAKGDTFEAIVLRLLDFYEKRKAKRK